MIPIETFLNLRGPLLDQRVLREWQHAADADFVAYVEQHHHELDYQHLRCAFRILQNVNQENVRELFKHYLAHREPGYRSMAAGSLEEQWLRGWCLEPAGTF